MTKNNKFWRLVVGLVSLAMLLIVSQVATPAKAATNHNGADFTTSASVTNGPDFKHKDTIDIQYNLDFGNTPIKNGDTITLDFPENLKGKTPGDTFKVYDETGLEIGEAVVSDTGVVITMNDKLEGKTNDKLTLNLATKYRYEDSGEKDVNFPLENNGNSTSQINIVDNEANMSKKGVIQDDGTIKWSILVDRREIDLENLKISDTIGSNQELIPGVTVSNAEWSTTTSYKRKKPALVEGTDYDVTYKDKGFDMSFNDTVDHLIIIDYYTKVTDPSLIDSGYKFKNNAVMSWGGGNGDKPNSEEANGNVSSSTGNNGSGGGDIVDPDGNHETDEEEPDEDTGTGTDDVDEGFVEDKATTDNTKKKKTPAKTTNKSAKKAAAKATATQTPGKTTTNSKNSKLPQTNDQNGWIVTVAGFLTLISLSAVLRRRF
ncbi:LPXTG cell wall anchor domain-containing protein [Levilactobacillus humaensis]|uniref:LPXTG cell wall anchor domain-containing protein n=1 Tax=Levilactobacillus humaensis TaxID=2950375 RepID=UPI0021C43F65|nr:LPXTG cell wall anchor domain-containing protein [Levilactobacillus humaensis]